MGIGDFIKNTAHPLPESGGAAHAGVDIRPNTRKLTIIAKDPGVRFSDGTLALAEVDVPAEDLVFGPTGYRVAVCDYDASARVLYKSQVSYQDAHGQSVDPFASKDGEGRGEPLRLAYQTRLLADPNFHSQNVYAIVMRTLARFEFALGRRLSWSFGGHQLNAAPHAFLDANAFYSEEDRGLLFGYFTGVSEQPIFTCLSHDIVAHETTHALLDGLRCRYTEPSTPDQAAFHEAFADIVAILSIFGLPEIVARILDEAPRRAKGGKIPLISGDKLTIDALAESVIAGLALETGRELADGYGGALRQSVRLQPDATLLEQPEFLEEHRRGEVLVAAMIRSFLGLWRRRIEALGTFGDDLYNLGMVVEEGAKLADHLLTMAIRAIDYAPPTDVDFSAYLAALLTADAELVPDDSRYGYRQAIKDMFAAYGIAPPSEGCQTDGAWCRFERETRVTYARSHFESMLRDKDEVFRFIWENREVLGINERGHIEVDSVRPSTRQGPDGFLQKETVCTYVQVADIFGSETKQALGIDRPAGMPTTQRITAYGGGVIIFDQYGRIKYHIAHRLGDGPRQARRLDYLWELGATATPAERRNRFAVMHRTRMEG